MPAEKFGDVVDMDTIFFHRTKEGSLSESLAQGPTTIQKGITLKDRATKDINVIVIKSRAAPEAKRALVRFGGDRNAISKVVSDNAPEFKKACDELDIAQFEATPGRSASHAVIEWANRSK